MDESSVHTITFGDRHQPLGLIKLANVSIHQEELIGHPRMKQSMNIEMDRKMVECSISKLY